VSAAKPVFVIPGADLAQPALELLTDFEVVYAGKAPSEDDIVGLCRQHDPVAMIVRYGKVGAAAMDAAPSLKVISKHGSGTDTIDKMAAAARGIEVVAAVGANAAAVAEQALALSLELGGRTVGLIGLGAIGQRFARMADAMGMRVIGFDPYAKNLPDFITPVGLGTIWREADVISLHCPLTDDNRNLLNAQTLAQCKRGVIVVNTARGGLIDEAALLAALASGQVASAGLDSFQVEPMTAGHPFQGVGHLTLSPHIGGVTGDAYLNMGVAAARNALAVLERHRAAA
jgi:D-3-phosphoglycerate dehydrogenase / 2-oxoglutarate reductase